MAGLAGDRGESIAAGWCLTACSTGLFYRVVLPYIDAMSAIAIIDAESLRSSLAEGRSVAEIATASGVSRSAIYMSLRRAGISVGSVTDDTRVGVRYRDLPGEPGIRVGNDGSIQSCRRVRTGELTAYWRDLRPQRNIGGPLVQIGQAGSRRRYSLRQLIERAWGRQAGKIIANCEAIQQSD